MRVKRNSVLLAGAIVATILWPVAGIGDKQQTVKVSEDFEKGADRWKTTEAAAWELAKEGDNQVFSLIKKVSAYKPPHRSPHNIALLKDVLLGDFVLTAKLKTTEKSYGHRSMCLFFGYQDPAHFYYVHLGQKADDHANQIFIVNDAPRTKISTKTTEGTPWDDKKWHRIKIVRQTGSGLIRIFFDDMETPVMEAKDKTFSWGQVGIGSFDDKGMFDDITVEGVRVVRALEKK